MQGRTKILQEILVGAQHDLKKTDIFFKKNV